MDLPFSRPWAPLPLGGGMCLALWYGRRAAPSAPVRRAQGVRDMHVRRDSFRPLGRGLGPLGRSPIHVPLELNLSALTEMRSPEREARNGTQNLGTSGPAKERDSLGEWHTQFRREGIVNQVYLCGSAFWIVHHDAIET